MLIIEENLMVLEYEALVPYELLDKLKITAQKAGIATDGNLNQLIGTVVGGSRGESVFVIEQEDQYLGLTVEGLGTKSMIATEMEFDHFTEEQEAYECFSNDTVAMIANDMITLGVKPIMLGMYLALGSADLLVNPAFEFGIMEGWAKACNEIGAVMGPGDTLIQNELTHRSSFSLSGAAVGLIKPKKHLVPQKPHNGDWIVLLSSSGVHANGLTAMRRMANVLPDGYKTMVGEDKNFGQWLLTPTYQYTDFIMKCLDHGVKFNGLINITGHGFRKIMRCNGNFHYYINQVPHLNSFWEFVLDQGVDIKEAYRTYNMGAGFAMLVPPESMSKLYDVYYGYDFEFVPYEAGRVLKHDGPTKKVTISTPTFVDTYNENELKIR